MQERYSEKTVLDTNVIISACFWTGSSHKILMMADKGKIKIIITKEILEEFIKVLNSEEIKSKIELKKLKTNSLVIKIIQMSEIIETRIKINICEDPDDNKFLEAAIESKAKYIVTKDKHLLKLKNEGNTKIVTPEEFLQE